MVRNINLDVWKILYEATRLEYATLVKFRNVLYM